VSFFPSFHNGGKRITRRSDTASRHLFSTSGRRWAAPGQALHSHAHLVRAAGTCPKCCGAPGTPTLPPRRRQRRLEPTHIPHRTRSAPRHAHDTARLGCCWAVPWPDVSTIRPSNQSSLIPRCKKNLSDIGHARKIYRQPRLALKPFLILQEELILHEETVTAPLDDKNLLLF